jgi:A/G-specific adenine glycosylase
MHTAARKIVADHQSEFPKDFKSVLALPGIGRYTAGAICSFAYDQPTPIVEANTQRLYARLLRIEKPLTDTETQAALWAFAEKILTKQNSRSINQAVMELGSLVCQPKPRCQACPLVELCPTFAEGLQETIPAPKRKTVYEERHEVALIAANSQGQYLIRKCGPDEWWAGLWDFPRFVVSIASDVKTQEVDIRTKARQIFNLDLCDMPPLFSIKHSVTRFRITLACYRATVQSQPKNGEMRAERLLSGQPSRWVTLADLDSIPLSASGRRVVNRLAAKAGSKRATETL